MPSLFPHRRYLCSVLAHLHCYGGLRIDPRQCPIWQKLKQTNPDQAYRLLAILYSDTLGRLGPEAVSMLRSCLVMMICGFLPASPSGSE